MAATRFDRAYYDRFYRDPQTRVADPEDFHRLAAFVVSYLDFLRIPIDRAVDLGCGVGLWRDCLQEFAPDADYTGVEVSDYLCDEYGWQQGSVVDWQGAGRYDLVICQGVLQYLPARAAARAIDNLGRLCRGALFLEVLTRADWEANCDQRRTDGDVHLRDGDWYRRRLRRHFVNAGGGVFVHHDACVSHFELETLDAP